MQGEQRQGFIDVIKGICIIFIIVTHFSWNENERLQYFFPFWINMAVPIYMIISGYVYSLSYRKRNIDKIGEAYLLRNTVDKILRYTIPFSVAFFIEELVYLLRGEASFFWGGVKLFIVGGDGPGSYYYPIMMQFIFVYPIVFFIIRKYKHNGVFLCGFLNIVFEILQRAYGMNEECYRLLIFRYILLIAVGCYIAEGKIVINKILLMASFVIGVLFITAYCYLGYEPKLIIYWTNTSCIACLYIIPIMFFIFGKLRRLRFKPLEILGKASYNIFLVQMVWYVFGTGWLGEIIKSKVIHLSLNLLICVGVGVAFYYFEAPITRIVIKKVDSYIN